MDQLNFDGGTFLEFLAEHFAQSNCLFTSATNDSALILPKKIEPPTAALRFLLSNKRKEEFRMDREHVKGTAEKVKGTIKDVAGKVTDDKKLQTEGKFDKAKGSAHKVAGDVKDAVKHGNE